MAPWFKKALRWAGYALILLIALGAVKEGAADAVGVLCIIVVWATFRIDRRLSELHASVERRANPEV